MKAKELIDILSKNPDNEVMIALGSIRVAHLTQVENKGYFEKPSDPIIPCFTLFPENYKVVESKGVDY
jgi:hypothetical protein